jgi:hypothetical protein
VHASVALVLDCVAAADDVGALVEVAVAVATGVDVGAFAVVAAHPAMRTERTVAAIIRMRDIMQAPALRAL